MGALLSGFNRQLHAVQTMVWREVQRAIGELMITQDGEVTDTIGVTAFFTDLKNFKPWLGRIEAGLRIAPSEWTAGDRDRLLALHDALEGVIRAPSKFVPDLAPP
jgi:hypothetical protein